MFLICCCIISLLFCIWCGLILFYRPFLVDFLFLLGYYSMFWVGVLKTLFYRPFCNFLSSFWIVCNVSDLLLYFLIHGFVSLFCMFRLSCFKLCICFCDVSIIFAGLLICLNCREKTESMTPFATH